MADTRGRDYFENMEYFKSHHYIKVMCILERGMDDADTVAAIRADYEKYKQGVASVPESFSKALDPERIQASFDRMNQYHQQKDNRVPIPVDVLIIELPNKSITLSGGHVVLKNGDEILSSAFVNICDAVRDRMMNSKHAPITYPRTVKCP